MRRFRITVDGTAYEVTVEELDTPATAPEPLPLPAAAAIGAPVRTAAAPDDVLSPMTGVVASMTVAVGSQVVAGQPLLVLEAMKMHTPICAPRSGTVAALAVTPGAPVQEGQVLMTLS